MLGGMLAQNADGQRTVKCGSSAFAGDVTQSEAEAAFAVRQKIVEVAAKFPCGSVPRGEIDTRDFAGASGKKLALNFARGVQVAEQALLVFAGLLVQAAVFEGDSDIRAEGGEHALVLGGK